MRLLDHQHIRRKEERSLLHESSLAKVEMLRRSKKKSRKREVSESQSMTEEIKVEMRFKEFLTDKQKKERKELLVTRYRMIRSASQALGRGDKKGTLNVGRSLSSKKIG